MNPKIIDIHATFYCYEWSSCNVNNLNFSLADHAQLGRALLLKNVGSDCVRGTYTYHPEDVGFIIISWMRGTGILLLHRISLKYLTPLANY